MEIIKSHNGYEVYFPYTPVKTKALQALKPGGAYWKANEKYWYVPFSLTHEIEKLRAKYCKPNLIGSAEQKRLEIEPLPDLEIDIPLKVVPYGYQKKGIAYCLKHKRVLIGDDMGLGKTFQAVAVTVAAQRKCILVICPNAVKPGWQREYNLKAGWKSIILKPSIKLTWHQYHTITGIRVFITNYESLKSFFVNKINKKPSGKFTSFDIELTDACKYFDAIIIDECHRVKDRSTLQAKICHALARGREYRLLLSGTPFVNKHKDFFTQLNILGNLTNLFQSEKYFMDRYCGGASGGKNENGNELQAILKNHCYYRRNMREVFSEMPNVVRNIIYCELPEFYKKEYEKCESNLQDYLVKLEKSPEEIRRSMKIEALRIFMLSLHISALGKLESVYERIEEMIECEKKYVLFCVNVDIVEAVYKKFQHCAVFMNGKQTFDEKMEAKNKFINNKKCFLLVASIKVVGTGVDGLQQVCNNGGFIQSPWNPAESDQGEARLKRIGQLMQCTFDYFLGTGTKDERVYQIIEDKRADSINVLGSEDTATVIESDFSQLIKVIK